MTNICPTCGATRGSHAHGHNSNETTQIDVPTYLLPTLAQALMIGSTTAMMCSAPEAHKALDALCKRAQDETPPIAAMFERYEWYSLCHRVSAGVPVITRIADDGRHWHKSCWIEAVDPSGNAWPGPKRTDVMQTREFESQKEAEDVLRDLQAELDRLAPMKA
jgi:hypothetical protein